MREIDLSNKNVRTDLIIDDFERLEDLEKIKYQKTITSKDIIIEELIIDSDISKILNKSEGLYKNISFKDITDSTNYDMVLDAFVKTLEKILKELELDSKKSCMIVGLGNRKSTPDAIGPKTLDNIIVTHHLLEFGPLEDNYKDISILEPGVKGTTGMDAKDHIDGLVNIIKPDFLIVIDALKTTSTSRIVKTIQISNSGITPGSGVNNSRKELNKNNLNIPVIAIGVPSIIDSTTIVFDTLNYLLKKVSYEKDNGNNYRNKLAITNDFENYKETLNDEEKEKILGMLGTMDDNDLKTLLNEVLNPLDYNLMVTPKEIDFLVEKITKLIGEGLNIALHKIKRQNYT